MSRHGLTYAEPAERKAHPTGVVPRDVGLSGSGRIRATGSAAPALRTVSGSAQVFLDDSPTGCPTAGPCGVLGGSLKSNLYALLASCFRRWRRVPEDFWMLNASGLQAHGLRPKNLHPTIVGTGSSADAIIRVVARRSSVVPVVRLCCEVLAAPVNNTVDNNRVDG